MAVPDFQALMLPMLKLCGDGEQHSLAEAVSRLSAEFLLSNEERAEQLKSGQTKIYNRTAWAATYLRKAGLLRSLGPGQFELTERGKSQLSRGLQGLDVAFLEANFPEVAEFRKSKDFESLDGEDPAYFDAAARSWNSRPTVKDRIARTIEKWLPDEKVRRQALGLVAAAIENADEERSDAWYLRETGVGIRLMTGRLLACEVARGVVRLSFVGPSQEAIRTALAADPERDEEFKKIPGGIILTFPAEHASIAHELLLPGLNDFIDLAISRVRRAVSLEDHVPEGTAYISGVVGRDLPQPVPSLDRPAPSEISDEYAEDEESARTPRVRGRAPIFEHGQRSIASLMSDIEREVIALPDLQRPFVWEDTKVRDLLDSLFLGFPVGTLVLWHPSSARDAKAMGAERPGLKAQTLVIDGQQRLTSLFAVMRGLQIVGKDGSPRPITIAFRPRDGRFEVADAAIRRDPEFLPNVTELWSGGRPKPQIRRELIGNLRARGRQIDEQYEDAVERNLDRAHSISDYRFPTVDIRKTAAINEEEATEEDVAEIFVRINNQGTRLGQADFVLTLLSVFHGDLRDRIEERAQAMSRGAVVGIDTQQLLRAACAVAFGRARMSAVYRFLRGVDPSTGEADTADRLSRLEQLDTAGNDCMDQTLWRDYLLRVRHAGFVNQSVIASKNAIVNAFAFYVRGRKAGVKKPALDELISRWLFGTLLTARYSGSSETVFEQDLARVTRLHPQDPEGFVRALDDALSETLTSDYWTINLVTALETQKARSPAALAFRAAQVVLNAKALFSDQSLATLLDPDTTGARAASEVHHLFPGAWLVSQGIDERRWINQVANLADTGWYENSAIGGQSPADYVSRLRRDRRIDDERWGQQCAEHALPPSWERMDNEEFLRERRRRMADVVRIAYRQLGGERDAAPLSPPWFLPGTQEVWLRISDAERSLRAVIRAAYSEQYGDAAARRIEEQLSERDREALNRALRARPTGVDELSVVDYLYLGQLPALLFSPPIWSDLRTRLPSAENAKQSIHEAVATILPVRNEIAHIREVSPERLLRARVACTDLMSLLGNA